MTSLYLQSDDLRLIKVADPTGSILLTPKRPVEFGETQPRYDAQASHER